MAPKFSIIFLKVLKFICCQLIKEERYTTLKVTRLLISSTNYFCGARGNRKTQEFWSCTKPRLPLLETGMGESVCVGDKN